MGRALRDNSLTIFFGVLFVATLCGQAITGHLAFNQDQVLHHEATVSIGRYLTSSDFGQAVMENWQSEYLQFTLMMLATIWLLQRGSPESKKPSEAGLESDAAQKVGPHASTRSPAWARTGGLRTAIYSNSLLILMLAIWLGSWLAQSVTGWSAFDETLRAHHQAAISWASYVTNAQFWQDTLQNWQSEFLAVGSFAAFAIFLRQRGSPESKPVGAPHDATATEG